MPLYRVGRNVPEVLAWSLQVDGVIPNGTGVRTSARTRGKVKVSMPRHVILDILLIFKYFKYF